MEEIAGRNPKTIITMNKQSLLWKIEHPRLKGICYVLGTMHAHDSRVLEIGRKMEPYALACDALACEIDLDTMPGSIESNFLLPDGQTLAQVLPAEMYKKLQAVFPRYTNNSLTAFERWKPMLLQNILTESAFLNDSPDTMDAYLWQFAKRQNKRLLGLESFDEQHALLEKLSLKWQIKLLGKTLKRMRSARARARRIIRAYLEQDLARLHKSAKKTGGKARKWLLYARNKTMAQRFWEAAQKQSLFAAVGAGHLLGSKGVLQLLKKQGAKVRPVVFE